MHYHALQQNGLLRLVDILRWPQVSAHAGSSRNILSFQRGILPVLRVRLSFLLLERIQRIRFSTCHPTSS
jgi:hypothetical protein